MRTLAQVALLAGIAERQATIDVLRRAETTGLNRGTSGNASFRSGAGFVITPSAMAYDVMKPEDLVFIDATGRPRGDRRPSSEWLFHRRIYVERNDVHAIVHLHSPAATALSTLRQDIPAFHYMVAVAGGRDIRCSDYATFGTEELATYAVDALVGRRACLLANHGLIACGPEVKSAYHLAIEVECLAEQYLLARSIGEPTLLSAAEMDEVLDRFLDYHKPR